MLPMLEIKSDLIYNLDFSEFVQELNKVPEAVEADTLIEAALAYFLS